MERDLIAYLDTQVVIWLMQVDLKRISGKATRLIESAELFMSPMVMVELELLYEIDRIKLPWPAIQAKLEAELGVRICDLPFTRVAHVALGESWTRDPFDRMIVAQAKANGLAYLISADEMIRQHYQRTIW